MQKKKKNKLLKKKRTEKNRSLALRDRELNRLLRLNLDIPQLHLGKRRKISSFLLESRT
jgi:hypothetical protein